MRSAFRISRERSVRLPPALIRCRPLIQVTLSKIWKSFWFVISGWFPFEPRFRDPPWLKVIWLIAEVA